LVPDAERLIKKIQTYSIGSFYAFVNAIEKLKENGSEQGSNYNSKN
jgi:hypothetical protein